MCKHGGKKTSEKLWQLSAYIWTVLELPVAFCHVFYFLFLLSVIVHFAQKQLRTGLYRTVL